MPISLWNDHSEDAETSLDLRSLKEKYISDGIKVVKCLRKNSNILAAWLSGPFKMPRISPTSDLHMAVLTQSGRDIIYQHQLPHFSKVGRRLEIAFFPLDYLQSILENGYSCWDDVFDLHKLNEIEVLYDEDRILSKMRKKILDVRPARSFVGKQIEALKAESNLIEQFLKDEKYEESIMYSRKMLMISLMLLMLITKDRPFSKLSHLYPRLKSHFSPSQIEMFTFVQAVAGLNKEDTEKRIKMTRSLGKSLFER